MAGVSRPLRSLPRTRLGMEYTDGTTSPPRTYYRGGLAQRGICISWPLERAVMVSIHLLLAV